jgi:hypothetical protein
MALSKLSCLTTAASLPGRVILAQQDQFSVAQHLASLARERRDDARPSGPGGISERRYRSRWRRHSR